MCLVYTSMSIPYLLSAPVGGWIADATGVYWPSIVLSGDATHRSVKMRPFAPLPLTPPSPAQPLRCFWVHSYFCSSCASQKSRRYPD